MSSHPQPAATRGIAASAGHAAQPRSFLAFKLGREEYGVPIESVQEIHAFRTPTPTAHSPALVCGVLDLRGAIAPIVDLRRVLKASPMPHEVPSAIVALRLGPLANEVVGVIVDCVTGVVDLRHEQLLPLPRQNGATIAERLIGIGRIDERLLMLLDLAAVLGQAPLGLAPDALH